jgi:protein O-mannosyl-transferase
MSQKQNKNKVANAPKQEHKKALSYDQPKLVKGLSIILFLLAFFLYANTLGHDYALDDYSVIPESPQTKAGFKGIPAILKSGYRTNNITADVDLYRPLSKVMFAIEWQISNGEPQGISHFMNVLLYAITAVLLFRMLRLYFKNTILLPFLTTAFFIIHPIHTEVVANIKGRDEILALLFLLLTATSVFKYFQKPDSKGLIKTFVFFFLAFLSKESTITFLLVFPLMIYFFTDWSFEKSKKETMVLFGGLLGVTSLFLLIRYIVLLGGDGEVPSIDNFLVGIPDFITQKATAIYLMGVYLWKLFVPHPLLADASTAYFGPITLSDWRFLLPFLIFLAAAVYAFMKFKTKNKYVFAILFFFITSSVASNLVLVIGTNYAERLMYVPSLAIALLLASLLVDFVQKPVAESYHAVSHFLKTNTKSIAFLGLLTLAYGYITINRNAEWYDNRTLYVADLQNAPNSAKLNFYLATHISQKRELEKLKSNPKRRIQTIDSAIVGFKKAIRYYPKYAQAMQDMAGCYYEKEQYDSSAYYYQQAIKIAPLLASYHNNYGRTLFTVGKLDEAQTEFQTAINQSNYYGDALNNMAAVYGTKAGNMIAIAQTDSLHRDSLITTARSYFQTSLQYSTKALTYNPDFVEAYETTAVTYGNLGDKMNEQKYKQMATQLRNQKK